MSTQTRLSTIRCMLSTFKWKTTVQLECNGLILRVVLCLFRLQSFNIKLYKTNLSRKFIETRKRHFFTFERKGYIHLKKIKIFAGKLERSASEGYP